METQLRAPAVAAIVDYTVLPLQIPRLEARLEAKGAQPIFCDIQAA